MKSLRNKVLLSGIVLLFALVATIGSTYAWFTVSNTVTVNQFSVTANTEQALLGRVFNTGDSAGSYTSADDFFNTLNIMDPDNDGNNNGYYYGTTGPGTDGIDTWRLTPLTALNTPTTNNKTDYTAEDFTALKRVVLTQPGDGTRTYTNYSTNENTSSGGFITVKFWLMDPSHDNTTVTLSSLSVTSPGNTALADSIYVGILGDGNQNIYPVDPDLGFEFLSGQPGYDSVDTDINTVDPASAAALLNATTNPSYNRTANDGTIIITLNTAMTPELVTAYIWIEGWDAQATNGVMGYSLNINFNFAIVS
jgi:hypothetical protein